MPFNKKAVLELRLREGPTQEKFLKKLEEALEIMGYGKHNYTQPCISMWESGKRKPTYDDLDMLYSVSTYFGHHDLDFYVFPDNLVLD